MDAHGKYYPNPPTTASPQANPPAPTNNQPEPPANPTAQSTNQPAAATDTDNQILAELFDEEGLDEETHAILQSRIAKSTRKNYIDTLFRFIRFIFDNIADFEGIINPILLQRMIEAHALDQARMNTNGRPCKRRDHIKKAVTGFIAAIVGGRAETHPLVLRRLTFNVFAK